MPLMTDIELLLAYIFEILIVSGIIGISIFQRIYRTFIPKPLKSLQGQNILITGSGNGIGKAIVHELAGLGATLICWDVDTTANNAVVSQLRKFGAKAYAYSIDLSNIESIRLTAQKVKEEIGTVSVVINNAGLVPNGRFTEITATQEELLFKVNVLSHFEILRQFLPEMIQEKRGHVVTIASIGAILPAKELAAYTASKHANLGFIEALKQEVEDLNASFINFTTVYPCFVRTRQMDGIVMKPKFPFNFPVVSPEYVAQRTVEGLRRDEEDIFIPRKAALLPILRSGIPSEAKRRMQHGMFKVTVCREDMTNNNK